MITSVIFDMDGVLLDTEKLYTQSTQQIVARFGKTFDWSVKADMIGRPALDSARHLVDALALPMAPEEYLAEREGILETLMPTAEPMPGARELTDWLRAAGVPHAVATSSASRIFGLKTTKHRAWFETFSVVVTGDDPRIARGKPAPDIFLLAAAELGVAPAQCVVVEDAPSGVAAGRAAGMRVVAVPDPAMDRARYGEADVIVGSLHDVTRDVLGLAERVDRR